MSASATPAPKALPIGKAAAVLGLSVRQVRRDIAAGAPVARRGGRGRGKAALIEPVTFSAWRCGQQEDAARSLASELPEAIAEAMYEAWRRAENIDKRKLASFLVGIGSLAIIAVNERLRRLAPDVPKGCELPPTLERLRHIFDDSCTVNAEVDHHSRGNFRR